MGLKQKIIGNKYDIRVARRKIKQSGEPSIRWDKAAEIEDDKTGEKKLKFKTDGVQVPKPSESKIDTLIYKKWYHALTFQPEQRTKFLEYIDYGDGDGDFVEFEYDTAKAQASDKTRIFETSRTLTGKKILEVFSEKDNKELYLLATMGIMVVISLGGMYVIVSGVKGSITSSVQAGITNGLKNLKGVQQATGQASNAAPGLVMPFAFIGYSFIEGIKSVRDKVRFWK